MTNRITVDVAYSDRYLDWTLGPSHPTDPVRARIAVDLLRDELPQRGAALQIREPRASTVASLLRVHDRDYVEATLLGDNEEWALWEEPRPDLGRTAAVMCGGTELLARRILAGATRVGFNPQGAKHHAHRGHGGGFCVFNDMALAADLFIEAGWRVAYLDVDAHHGDGVEALLRDRPEALTASVHNVPLFPGTGLVSDSSTGVHNWPLTASAGDEEWLAAIGEAADIIHRWRPDVLLAAIGADAHRTDPLSRLQVTEAAYAVAGRTIGAVTRDLGVAVLIGGAGGYQPRTWTPRLWADVVGEVASSLTDGPLVRSSSLGRDVALPSLQNGEEYQ